MTQNLVSGGKITLSNYACLPPSNTVDNANVGRTPWVYGWGRFGAGPELSNVLRETRGEVLTRQICDQKYGRRGFVKGYHICFDNPAGKGFFYWSLLSA